MIKSYNVPNPVNRWFSKKLLCVLLVIMAVLGSAKAQISVTATAGTLGPSPYTTLKGAFDAINAGTHQGEITVSVIGNTLETATAILNGSGTPASYTRVVIKPNAPGRVITGSVSPSIIKLNGADKVTFDGSSTVGGTTRDLTISNSSSSNTTGVIWLASASGVDGSTNDTVKNCIVTGQGPTTTFLGIVQSSGTTMGGIAEAANSNNTYSNNAVSAAQYGIGVVGQGGNEDANTVISGNNIGSTNAPSKMGHGGIFLAQQKSILVTGNIITGVTSTVGGFSFQTSGIEVRGTFASGGLIEKNKISDIKIAGFWGCNGIQLNSSTAATNLVIANNMIYDVAAGGFVDSDTVDDNGFGIAVVSGGGYKIQYNSIDLHTNQNSGKPAAMWIGGGLAAASLDIRNNIFSNTQTIGTRFAIFSNSANTVFSAIDFNDYYSLNVLGFLGANQATLGNWQTATGQDANSLAVNPSFTSLTDLHLFFNSPLDGLATPIAGVTQDFDSEARTATPDIGADEFTPPNCTNPVINGFPATASTTDICASGSATLSASGYSYGVGIQYLWEWSANGLAPWNLTTFTNPASANTGNLTATRYFRLRVQCSGGAFGYSTIVQINVNNPAVSGTTPGSRCGVGTVTLGAVGGVLKWYTASTGGTPLATGSPFTTPVISATTTYYVSSTSGATPCVGGKPSTAGGDAGYSGTDAGLVFDVTQQFTLDSVKMYPQAAGDVMIQVLTSTGGLVAALPIPHHFNGATSTGVYVPLNFTIPTGTGYRLIVSSNTSSISIWRDFGGNTFPYPLCAVGSITNGWLGGGIATYYFFYDWHITTGCESTRTPVVATVTPPPAFTSVSPAAGPPRTICSGSSVTLNAVGGGYTTYTWYPGALPNGSVVSPTTTTTYTLIADIPGGCRRDEFVTITVNSTPTTLTVTPNGASVCPNTPTAITTTGGLIPGQTIFTETAETFPFSQWTLSNSGSSNVNLGQNTTYYQQGIASMWLTHGDFADGAVATTNNINLTGFLNPTLSFYHIAALEATSTNHYDVGYVEYSTDGGSVWTRFPTSTYTGSANLINGFVAFDNTSYPDWDAQFSNGASTPGAAPATSMWKQESINLTSWQGSANFKIRFHLITDVSILYYGWLIDNIKIIGTGQAPITWSPAGNLFTNAAATIPYVAGSNAPNVWYNVAGPTAAVTYTATATAGVSCISAATTTLSASSLSASVSITSNPSGAICSGQCVTFTAAPTNGGAPPGYQWFVNAVSQGPSTVGANTFTKCNLANGDQVYCQMSVNPNVGSCIVATVVTSNTITLSVNPTPTANPISGSTGTTVCTGTPNLLTETPVGTITTFQWFLDGSPVGTNSNTYSATAPGTYTVAVTSNLGCKDTSANFVITQPTYTITATAGPNGTINPSGAVSVPCGDDITFTITPNPGYAIQDVLVNGGSVGPVGSYTFNDVTGDSTIHATFFIAGCATPATSYAGPDASICAGPNFTLSGLSDIGGSATSGTWSTSGDGTFNPTSNVFGVATSYTPGPTDLSGGTVDLTLTTDDPAGSCLPSTSTMTLTIDPSPVVNITGQIGLCSTGATTTWLVADTSATTVSITSFTWYHPPGTPIPSSNNDSLFVAVGQTGGYTVTVMGSNGCSATDAVSVNIFPSPSVSIAGAGPICTNSTVDINATASGGTTPYDPNGYTWYLNGTPQGTNTSILGASAPGNYTVTATDANGCISALSAPALNLALDNSPLNGNYTIGMGPASCTNYISFKTAIQDLNNRSISGNVLFSVPAGYTELVASPGLILGKAALNAATATGLTITFLKSGAGANPLLTAFTGGGGIPTIAIPDGIFKLRGVDNVSINQVDLTENPSNSGVALMDFGYGLFRLTATDGAQNNSIQGCVITLSKANSLTAGGQMSEGSTGIIVIGAVDSNAIAGINPTTAAGTNSNNKFYANTIQDCHNGFWLSGYAAPSPFTLADNGNDIGGTSAVTGNTIINFGNAGDATPPSAVKLSNQWNANVSFNTIDNNNGSGVNTNNELRGIWGFVGASASATISNNSISLKSGATGGQAVVGIQNAIGSTPASNTVTINANTITGSGLTVTSAPWTGILNSATAATVNISGNTVQNVTLAGTGVFIGINNTAAASLLNINNNNVLSNSKSGTGTMSGISVGAPAVASIVSNVVSNNTITGGGAACTLNSIIGAGTGSDYTLDGNTMYNNGITGMSGTAIGIVYGFYNNSSPDLEILTDNIIRKLYVTGTSTGIHVIRGLITNTNPNSIRTCLRNQVDSLYSNAASTAQITGIHSQVGGTVTIAYNKIHSLFAGQNGATAAFVKGISIAQGTTEVKVHNNMVSLDLTQAFTPAANNVLVGNNAVSGIELNNTAGVPPLKIYYNTIRLAGGGSGTGFGSSGIAIVSATGSADIRNNITVNLMTPGGVGAGVTAALRKTGAATHALTSNNNLWYTTETATTPIAYYNGTAYATLAAYQAIVIPRDTSSIIDIPVFVSIPANDLHLAGNNCGIDGMAQPIATYTDDFDAANVRDPFAPDMGADEFEGTGGSGIWKGVNTDWLDPVNWCGVVPTATTNVIIPKRSSGNYPIIPIGVTTPVANNITINQFASITIDSGGKLSNKGQWLINGTLTNNGTIELNGTANQLFPNAASTGTLAAMTNLTVTNPAGATFDKDLTLTGVLKPNQGAITINNNITVTLHSDLSGTASVDTVKAGASIAYVGTGKFSIERYISSATKTAWRFLGVPLIPASAQTINQAWQEGQTPGQTIPATGYGTQIVGPASAGFGFDQNTVLPSVKKYDILANDWVPIPGTTGPIAANDGYMAFIRGDRDEDAFGETGPTTLRTAGQVNTGNITVSTANTNTNKYLSVANPYPCAVSYGSPSTVKTGLQDFYYLWDPQRGTYGAYVTFAGPGYAPSTPGGSYTTNNAIESGQAFFAYTNGTVGTHSIQFSENSKASSNVQVARMSALDMQFRTRLFVVSGSNLALYDGNRVDFDNSHSNELDERDAPKMTNANENLGILRNGKLISIERRAEIVETDTIFFNLSQFRQQEYQLEFTPENLATTGLTAWLEDTYLHTSTVVDLSSVTTVNFTVTADAASKAADRFRIVFRQLAPVPLSFTSVSANRLDKNIMVNWKVDNELNIATYEVEGASNGVNFRKLSSQPAMGNGSGVSLQYNWLDEHPFIGINYYRIKSIGISGAIKYSQVVKVNMSGDPSLITVYPNPVKDRLLRVAFTNMEAGDYEVRLYGLSGQLVLQQSVNHPGGNQNIALPIPATIAKGMYNLEINMKKGKKQAFRIMIE